MSDVDPTTSLAARGAAGLNALSLLAAIPDAALVADLASGEVVATNEALRRMFGRTDGARRLRDLLADAGNRVAESGRAVLSLALEGEAGAPMEVEVRLSEITSSRGSYALAVLRAATPETNVRSDIARNRTLLEAVLDRSPTVIYMKDEHGKFLFANRECEKAFGRPRSKILGRTADEVLPPMVASQMQAHDSAMLASGTPVETEEIFDLGGPEKQIFISVRFPLQVAPDAPPVICGISTDITERKAAEDALKAAERRYRSIFKNAAEGIFQTDRDGRLLMANDSLAHTLGYSSPRHLLENVDNIAEVWVDVAQRERFLRRLQEPGAVVGYELEGIRRDGSRFWTSVDVYPAKDESGQIAGYQGMTLDVTARKEAERELTRAKEEAERANRAKSEFLSRMSHELRTPLNAILGFAQLLQLEELNEAQLDYVDQIWRGGAHLLRLINEVLDISRIETGRLEISLEPVSAGILIGECIDLIRPLADRRRVRLLPPVTPEEDIAVTADRHRLKQVLLNLLANGVKYNRPGGAVWVHLEAGPDRVFVRVLDNGPGIPHDKIERVFVPFDRLGAEQSGVEGTGLGLALSKRLVEAMGGLVTVDSVVGEKTTFSVELPIAAQAPRSADEQRDQVSDLPGGLVKNVTALYIEDNVASMRLVEQLMSHRPGIRLLSAMQASIGLELAREHLPDIILLDLNLPDLSGEDVLSSLQSIPDTAAIPVVIVSAEGNTELQKRLMNSGARAFLTKPFKVDDFFTTIDRVLLESSVL